MVKTIQENREKAEQMTNEISSLLETASISSGRMSDIEAESQNNIETIKKNTDIVSDFVENTFNPIKDIILDSETGLETVFNNATDSLNNIVEIEEQITTKKTELEVVADDTEKLKTTNQNLQIQIEKMLGIASDKVLSKGLEEKTKSLLRSKWIWFGMFIIVMAGSIRYGRYTIEKILIFQTGIESNLLDITKNITGSVLSNNNLTHISTLTLGLSFARFIIFIPIFFFGYTAFKEYNKANDAIIKYEYKVAMASSLESYIQLLLARFIDENEFHQDNHTKVLDFALDRIKDIYQEPIFSEKTMQLDLQAKIKEYEMKIKLGGSNTKQIEDIKKNTDVS